MTVSIASELMGGVEALIHGRGHADDRAVKLVIRREDGLARLIVSAFGVRPGRRPSPLDAQPFVTGSADAVELAAAVIAGDCDPAILADALNEVATEADALTCVGVAAYALRTATTAPGAVVPAPRFHASILRSGIVRLTDTDNAGKRGKTCDRVTVYGDAADYGRNSELSAPTQSLFELVSGFDPSRPFAELLGAVMERVGARLAAAGARGDTFGVEFSKIKSVHAPVRTLHAYAAGTFEATADADSVWIEDLADVYNGQTWTNRGNPRKAYAAAAKVWDKVRAAKTHREAVEVLEAAGIEFRIYCSVD